MKKYIVLSLFLLGAFTVKAQKLQLTEAATEYKNNFSSAWMMQPDQMDKNKAILKKAKSAIDESYSKQIANPILKSKDETKMYYYRGMIYLDYAMMASMDQDILNDIETMGDEAVEEAAFGSLKKCIEMDVKNQWKSAISNRIEGLRALLFNGGADLFNKADYKNAYESFKGSVQMYDVLSKPDTLAMINAALAAEKLKNYDDAYTFFKMCADNNYGKGAEMYQSMVRVLNAADNENKDEEKILSVIEEGKKKFPGDFVLNVEEFNYWYAKGDNDKAQQALQNAITADPNNKILHFNIGVTYDNLSNKSHDAKDHVKAVEYMNKAIEGYTSAINIDENYVDAYYNLGALYYNQSITLKSVAGDLSGEEYDAEMARADEMLKKAIPLLEKVLTLAPTDKSTLTVLKSLYFNLDDMDNYSRIKKLLDSL